MPKQTDEYYKSRHNAHHVSPRLHHLNESRHEEIKKNLPLVCTLKLLTTRDFWLLSINPKKSFLAINRHKSTTKINHSIRKKTLYSFKKVGGNNRELVSFLDSSFLPPPPSSATYHGQSRDN